MTHAPALAGLEPVAPEEAGFDPRRLAEAVDYARYARAHESTMDRDIGRALSTHSSEPLPDGEIIGPTRPRGDPSGMILRGGRVAASWGPVDSCCGAPAGNVLDPALDLVAVVRWIERDAFDGFAEQVMHAL